MPVKFNVQTYLHDMREEQQRAVEGLRSEMLSGHKSIGDKVDKASDAINTHETRISGLESDRRKIGWFTGAMVTAGLGFLVAKFGHK